MKYNIFTSRIHTGGMLGSEYEQRVDSAIGRAKRVSQLLYSSAQIHLSGRANIKLESR